MGKSQNKWGLVLWFQVIFLIFQTPATAQSKNNNDWRSRTRLQIGVENDDNITEVSDARLSNTANSDSNQAGKINGRNLKLLFQFSGEKKNRVAYFDFKYRSGLQAYWNHAYENKLINEVEGLALFKTTRHIQIGMESWGRLKIFLNENFDYAYGYAGPFGSISLPFNLNAKLGLRLNSLDYANSDSYDYAGPEYHFSVKRQIYPGTLLKLEVINRNLRFNRTAFKILDNTNGSQSIYAINENQSDNQNQFALAIEYSRKFLFHIRYLYDKNSSNSYGYDFNRHRLVLIFGGRLPFDVLLRGFATYQDKNYTQPLNPFLPLELDTEREESNFLILDFSRNLTGNIAGLLRFAWYKNESLIRAQYYEKKMISFAFELRF